MSPELPRYIDVLRRMYNQSCLLYCYGPNWLQESDVAVLSTSSDVIADMNTYLGRNRTDPRRRSKVGGHLSVKVNGCNEMTIGGQKIR